MITEAHISRCGKYRYSLRRHWGDPSSEAILAVCMLNPSTADANIDDPTIRRCIGYAKREGCDGLYVVNLYAYRATSPRDLFRAGDPIGWENDRVLAQTAQRFPSILCAWGSNAKAHRAAQVARIFRHDMAWLGCLGTTQTGAPRHPLYLRADVPIVAFEEAA